MFIIYIIKNSSESFMIVFGEIEILLRFFGCDLFLVNFSVSFGELKLIGKE